MIVLNIGTFIAVIVVAFCIGAVVGWGYKRKQSKAKNNCE